MLIGVSRKSFMGQLLGTDVQNRLPAALACTTLAVGDGANIIRTHDVAETVQAVAVAAAIRAARRGAALRS
jgi:dihydropteroate synthase